jgi:prepilin-type N-terminal cleavage/methylation domain-containing protein
MMFLSNSKLKTVNRKRWRDGFSLIEMIVAIGLFSVVMLISISSLLALASANRKAQALQSVMNNLNTAIDGMVRTLRMGSIYHCGNIGSYDESRNCTNGDLLVAFEAFGGDPASPNDQWVYWYDANTKRMYKSENSGVTQFALTAPEIQVDEARFYVVGADSSDQIQPKVVIVLRGTAGAENVKTRSTFSVQSTAVQRIIDI